MEYFARNVNKNAALNEVTKAAKISIKEIYKKKGKKEETIGVKIDTDKHDIELLKGLAEFDCDKNCIFDGDIDCYTCAIAKYAKSVKLVKTEKEFIEELFGLEEELSKICPTPHIPCDSCGHYNFSNKEKCYKCNLGLEKEHQESI